MSNPIDVGSVLGGRYKVTATVLASHDHDLVLDGVDQVLNRPVSILVAGPGNTEQVAQSAREVATGERPGTVQVLDLGMTEATTYLITNHTSAADLLDLVVASNPPYVEPFFTDTLGSEIFGQPRSHEPEPYDEEDHVEAGYINYGERHPNQVDSYRSAPVPPKPPVRPAAAPSPGRKPAGASAVGGAAAVGGAFGGAAAAGSGSGRGTAAADRSPLRGEGQAGRNGGSGSGARESTPEAKPKVSLWSDDDYNYRDEQPSGTTPADNEPQTVKTKSSLFPRSAAPAAAGATGTSGAWPADQDRYDGDDDEPGREPRSMRWLVGGLLAVVLIVGLVIAVTNLGSLTSTDPKAAPTGPATNSSAPENTSAVTQAPTSAAPPAVPPAIESISRQGTFDFAANFDRDLVRAYDGNAASYWSDMEFATENWGGLAPEGVLLVVKLENPAKISSVTLSQLGGSGGNITVYTNDRPALDGAKSVGTNSFTSTELTMPLAEPVKAQYVIVAINSLPRLAAPKTRYGYGIRLAEVTVK